MTSWGHFWALRVHRGQPWEVGAKDPRGCRWADGWLRHAQPVTLGSLGKTGHSLKGHLCPVPSPESLGTPGGDPGQELEAGKGREAGKAVGGGETPDSCWPGRTGWGSKRGTGRRCGNRLVALQGPWRMEARGDFPPLESSPEEGIPEPFPLPCQVSFLQHRLNFLPPARPALPVEHRQGPYPGGGGRPRATCPERKRPPSNRHPEP